MTFIETWRCGPPSRNGQRQQYPGRFEHYLRRFWPEFFEGRVLHMFAGQATWGVTTDIRAETGAQIVAPFDAIPEGDRSFDAVIADPPYANHYAGEWHTDLPQPKAILREAARLVRPGGFIGILHIIVIPAYSALGVQRRALHPVLVGPNNAVRVFNVFQRRKGDEDGIRAAVL